MLTRREVVLQKPFQDMRFTNHRRKVKSAVPRIDASPPPKYNHLNVKMKKLRLEKDRQTKICKDNIGLVHRMSIIMRTKRMDDINTSPKGPFEHKESAKKSEPRKSSGKTPQPLEKSFLESVTEEAKRRNTNQKPKPFIQHRSPQGFCKVPALRNQHTSSFLTSIEKAKKVYLNKSKSNAKSSNTKKLPNTTDLNGKNLQNSLQISPTQITKGGISPEEKQDDQIIASAIIDQVEYECSSDDGGINELREKLMNSSPAGIKEVDQTSSEDEVQMQRYRPRVNVVNESDEEFFN